MRGTRRVWDRRESRAVEAALKKKISQLPKPRILILSGGGGNGSAQAAAVEQLYRGGYVPDLIIGTSIGAWNGAYLAAHPSISGAQNLVKLWHSGAFGELAVPQAGYLVRTIRLRVASLIGPHSVQHALARTGLSSVSWKHLQIPLIVGATEAGTGALEYWDSRSVPAPGDPLSPYLAASSGLTPLQPASTIENKQYIDGGFNDNYGIREATRQIPGNRKHASIVIIDAAPEPFARSLTDVADSELLAEGLILHRHFAEDVAFARSAGIHVEILPVGLNHSITRFMEPDAGIAVGRQVASQWAQDRSITARWKQPSLASEIRAFLRAAHAIPFQALSHSIVSMSDRSL
ncbi:MAG: patatin-like phospholipase family protein [Candidatus Dormibacteria bacterium]